MVNFGRKSTLIILGIAVVFLSMSFHHNGLRSQCAFCIAKISTNDEFSESIYDLFIEGDIFLLFNHYLPVTIPVHYKNLISTRAPPV